MQLHPTNLIFLPVILIEYLFLVHYPVLGVTVPLTIITLVLMFQYVQSYRLLFIVTTIAISAELLMAVEKLSYLTAFLLLGAGLMAIRFFKTETPYTSKFILLVAAVAGLLFQSVVLLFSPGKDLDLWVSFFISYEIVLLGSIVVIVLAERVVKKVI